MINYININDYLTFTDLDEVAQQLHEAGREKLDRTICRLTENTALSLACMSSWNNRYIINPKGLPFFFTYNKNDLDKWKALGKDQENYYPLLYYEGFHRTQWGKIKLIEDKRMEEEWKALEKENKGKLEVIPETDTAVVVNLHDGRLPIFYLYNIKRREDVEKDFFRREGKKDDENF